MTPSDKTKAMRKLRLSERYDWTGLAQLGILVAVIALLLFWR